MKRTKEKIPPRNHTQFQPPTPAQRTTENILESGSSFTPNPVDWHRQVFSAMCILGSFSYIFNAQGKNGNYTNTNDDPEEENEIKIRHTNSGESFLAFFHPECAPSNRIKNPIFVYVHSAGWNGELCMKLFPEWRKTQRAVLFPLSRPHEKKLQPEINF